jgi:hypothetical protein
MCIGPISDYDFWKLQSEDRDDKRRRSGSPWDEYDGEEETIERDSHAKSESNAVGE